MNVAALIAKESAMLDAGDYESWFELFSDDSRYWMPYDWAAPAPEDVMNVVYDDQVRMKDRISRLTGGDLHAQDPASLTIRLLGTSTPIEPGIGWAPQAPYDEAVSMPFLLTESRRGEITRYSGRYGYWCRQRNGPAEIVAKKVQLIEAGGPLGNVTFIF